MKNVIANRIIHGGESRVTLKFPYDKELISIIKEFPEARWSGTMNCWHIKDGRNVIHDLFEAFKGKAYLDYSFLKPDKEIEPALAPVPPIPLNELSEGNKKDIIEFRRWMVHRRYSESTINTYVVMLGYFLRFNSSKKCDEIEANDMVKFVNEYVIPRKLSYTFQNQVISAAKLFFKNVYKKDFDV
jgi:integrase/recombinase XerD